MIIKSETLVDSREFKVGYDNEAYLKNKIATELVKQIMPSIIFDKEQGSYAYETRLSTQLIVVCNEDLKDLKRLLKLIPYEDLRNSIIKILENEYYESVY